MVVCVHFFIKSLSIITHGVHVGNVFIGIIIALTTPFRAIRAIMVYFTNLSRHDTFFQERPLRLIRLRPVYATESFF